MVGMPDFVGERRAVPLHFPDETACCMQGPAHTPTG